MLMLPTTLSMVAVTTAVPGATARTAPSAPTVTAAVLFELQVTVRPVMATPVAELAVAFTVSTRPTTMTFGPVTATLATTGGGGGGGGGWTTTSVTFSLPPQAENRMNAKDASAERRIEIMSSFGVVAMTEYCAASHSQKHRCTQDGSSSLRQNQSPVM